MPEPTAPEATPERWVVTVTRLDLRRGSLMLPYRLSGRFSVGALACEDAATGESQSLTVLDERSVEGLGGMYEAHDVQVNDRIVLHVLDGPALRVGFEKRVRSAPTDVQPSRWYSVHDDAPTVSVTAEAAEVGETSEPVGEPSGMPKSTDVVESDDVDRDADGFEDSWLVDDVTVIDAEPSGVDAVDTVSATVDPAPSEPDDSTAEDALDPFADAYSPPSAPTIVRDRPPPATAHDEDPFADLDANDSGPLARLGRFTRSLFAGNPSNLESATPSEGDEDTPGEPRDASVQTPALDPSYAEPDVPPEMDGMDVGWVEADALWLDDDAQAFSADGSEDGPSPAVAGIDPQRPSSEAPDDVPDVLDGLSARETDTPAAEPVFEGDAVPPLFSSDAQAPHAPDSDEATSSVLTGEEATADGSATQSHSTDEQDKKTRNDVATPTEDAANAEHPVTPTGRETVPSWLEPWRDQDQDATPAWDEAASESPEADEAVLPSGVPVPDRDASEDGDLRTRIARFLQSPDMPMIARSDVIAKRFSLDDTTAYAMLEDLADSPPRGLRLILVREGAWRIERTGV